MPAAITPSALRYWRHSRPAPARTGAGRPCIGWTQATAAAYLGVATATYARWERGQRKPPRMAALAISRELSDRGDRPHTAAADRRRLSDFARAAGSAAGA